MTASFAVTRDVAVAVGRSASCVPLADIDEAIAQADRAQAFGPILDPTLSLKAGASLDDQIRYLRAFRTFRAAIEEFRA